MTSQLDDPSHLLLGELEQRCARETRNYRSRTASDTRFCLEIFRRALQITDISSASRPVYVDEAARDTLVRLYTSFIEAHLSASVLHLCERDDIVQQTWLRFWQAAPRMEPFATLEAALVYLELTIRSTVIQAIKLVVRKQQEVSLQQLADDTNGEEQVAGGTDPDQEYRQKRFQARWKELIADPLDRRIFLMRYILGMPPREIAEELVREKIMLRGRTATARAVSDCVERSIEKLRRDPEIRDLLQAD